MDIAYNAYTTATIDAACTSTYDYDRGASADTQACDSTSATPNERAQLYAGSRTPRVMYMFT